MPFFHSIRAEFDEGDSFPFALPAVRSLKGGIEFNQAVNFFVGENGSGKSTVLEAIADKWGFSRQSGNRSKSPGSRSYWTKLARFLTLSRNVTRPMDGFFLRAESFFNFASEMDELEEDPWTANGYFNYGGKSLHEQSHGEAFLSLFLNRFDGHGIFLLDEPEAALSPARQLAFLVRLHDLVRENSQFIIATHSPIILAYPGATIFQFDEDGITETTYRETSHYELTRRFLEDPKRMIQSLFEEGG